MVWSTLVLRLYSVHIQQDSPITPQNATNGNIYNPHSLNGFKKFVPGFVDIIISRRDGVGASVAGIYEVRGGYKVGWPYPTSDKSAYQWNMANLNSIIYIKG
ncbi:hypothetical protein TWF217_008968 [Orbilia oligospora]|nr:hypothetical protein TWF217_008968 [Orbilia oligospora]